MQSFWGDNKGGVAMLFAIALVPMMAMVGVAIDYGAALRDSAALGAAADAAALTAIAPGSAAYRQAAAANGDMTLTVDSTPFTNLVKANLGNRRDMTINAPTVALVKSNGKITATVTYTASVQTSILSLFGFSSVPIKKVAVASINMQTYMDFYVLLDNSPSMGIAATPTDIATMVNNTSDQCAFACHDLSDKNNYYDLAKSLGVTMRIDLLRSATQNLMTTATANEAGALLFRFAVYTFGTTANVAHGAALSNVAPLSSNLSSVATQASAVDLMTVQGQNQFNDEDTSFDTALPALQALIPTPGDGSSSTAPKKVMFLITDGVSDENLKGRTIQPINTALCDAIKQNGVQIAVLYTTYYPLPTNAFYNSYVAPILGNVPTALQNCASPGLYAAVAPGGDISGALAKLFAQVTSKVSLTQ